MLNKITYIENYSYLLNILKHSQRQIDLDGSRGSGKSEQIAKSVVLLLASEKNIICYAFRKHSVDIKQSVQEELEKTIYFYKATLHKTERTYTFPNGNRLFLKSAYSAGNKKVSLKGVALSKKPKWIIIWIEERNEFEEFEINAILEALRDAHNIIVITSTNPDVGTHPHIEEIANFLPYDPMIMKTKGEQFKKNDYQIVHHTNFKINPFLPDDWIRRMNNLRKVNPSRAVWAVDGLPGSAAGAIYAEFMHLTKWDEKCDKAEYVEFVGGIDYGPKRDNNSNVYLAFTKNYEEVHLLAEHVDQHFLDKAPLTPDIMAQNSYEFFKDNYNNWTIKKGMGFSKLKTYVDWAGSTKETKGSEYAKLINSIVREKDNQQELNFQKAMKHPITERINMLTQLMSLGRFKIHPSCKISERELYGSVWDDNFKKPTRLDKRDHCINAIEYAVAKRKEKIWKIIKKHII